MDGVQLTAAHQTPGRRPIPTAAERPFGIDEIFFSTTDRKGIIRSGNRVFARVSGYSRAELVGSPHNLIRHPDMPRAVFKLLWDEIEAGRPIAAYVKNLAKDGAYYWVMATVVPCAGGYLSVRIKPSTPYFDAARQIYVALLAAEREIEQGDARLRKRAMEVSGALLGERLRGVGFDSYDAFMRTALLAEVKQRQAVILAPDRDSASGCRDQGLGGVLWACEALSAFLGLLVARLDDYAVLNESLGEKATFVLDLAEDVRLFSLNALLASTRVQGGGECLAAVASLMQSRLGQSGPVFRALADDVVASAELLSGMFFPVAATRLQAEIATVFVRELLEGRDGERATANDLGALAQCLTAGVDRLAASLAELDQRVRTLAQHVEHLRRVLRVMQALEFNGRIEAARVSEAEAVVTLFRTMADQIGTARREMDELRRISAFTFHAEATEARQSRRHVDAIREHVSLLQDVDTPALV